MAALAATVSAASTRAGLENQLELEERKREGFGLGDASASVEPTRANVPVRECVPAWSRRDEAHGRS